MREAYTAVAETLVLGIEACSAVVVVIGVARTIVTYVWTLVSEHAVHATLLRARLGRYLVMAIEFQVAADVIRTGVSPTWEELLRLGALIVLRSLLTFALELELRTLDSA